MDGWSPRRKASTCKQKHRKTHKYTQILNIHALSEIRTHDPSFRASEDSACLRPLGYSDRLRSYREYFISLILKYPKTEASISGFFLRVEVARRNGGYIEHLIHRG
jgi:hypothetical protein